MCGICGVATTRQAGVDRRSIERLVAGLRHRGPDEQGVELLDDGRVGLGHARLRVIDLSSAARQPLTNEDRTVWVVANGEIYNFRELRDELAARGHTFRSQTDIEVIVHLYEDDPEGFVERLWGMFAFALWDERRRRLVLARDRLGKKPLYYVERGGDLCFASELAPLIDGGLVARDVDPSAVDAFLTYGYIPAPRTILRNARKLPPAHVLTWEQGRTSLRRYWSLDYRRKRELPEAAWEEEALDLLRDAVRRRLVSDVPVGAFLSGGIDSSLVVSLIQEQRTEPIKTFSIGFDDESFNELPFARQVADRYRTDHHEWTVRPDAVALLPTLVEHFGEPYADSSALATFELSRLVRQHVTVALNGDGGDEVFAGYDRYRAALLAGRLDWIPPWAARLAGDMVSRWPESGAKRDRGQRVKRFLAGLGVSPAARYASWMTYFSDDARRALYQDAFAASVREGVGRARAAGGGAGAPSVSASSVAELWESIDAVELVDRLQGVDMLSYLPNDLLPKVDITSMTHALEVRSPLLDHRLFELSASMPASMKIRGGAGKHLLRRLGASRLPAEVLNRPKAGFGVPVGRWFRGPLSRWINDLLLSERAADRGYFRPDALRRVLGEHAAGAVDHGQRLWALACFELWHQRFMD